MFSFNKILIAVCKLFTPESLHHPLWSSFTLISQTARAKGLFVFFKKCTHHRLNTLLHLSQVTRLQEVTRAVCCDISKSHLIGICNQPVYHFVPGQQRYLLVGLDHVNQASDRLSGIQKNKMGRDHNRFLSAARSSENIQLLHPMAGE